MHILLVNDDGISSSGLHALIKESVKRGHQVTISAPNKQQSAVSQSLTFFRPIAVTPVSLYGAGGFAVDGTPADCARLGIANLAESPVDLTISGINDGLNSGGAIYCSGTVGAAREAAMLGVKAMAVSIDRPANDMMLAGAAGLALTMGERLVKYATPPRSVLNLNIPAVPCDQLLPAVMAPVNHGKFVNIYERRLNPHGDAYFWVTPDIKREDPEPGSDEDFLQKGHVTCTFLLHSPEYVHIYPDFLQDA